MCYGENSRSVDRFLPDGKDKQPKQCLFAVRGKNAAKISPNA